VFADAACVPAERWTASLHAPAGIEDLREKREQILKQIQDEENEKAKIQTELAALTQRLARINGQYALPAALPSTCAAGAGSGTAQFCKHSAESCVMVPEQTDIAVLEHLKAQQKRLRLLLVTTCTHELDLAGILMCFLLPTCLVSQRAWQRR
jgi:hypothetical protein